MLKERDRLRQIVQTLEERACANLLHGKLDVARAFAESAMNHRNKIVEITRDLEIGHE